MKRGPLKAILLIHIRAERHELGHSLGVAVQSSTLDCTSHALSYVFVIHIRPLAHSLYDTIYIARLGRHPKRLLLHNLVNILPAATTGTSQAERIESGNVVAEHLHLHTLRVIRIACLKRHVLAPGSGTQLGSSNGCSSLHSHMARRTAGSW
jgi:hypothetical protein